MTLEWALATTAHARHPISSLVLVVGIALNDPRQELPFAEAVSGELGSSGKLRMEQRVSLRLPLQLEPRS